MKGERGKGRGKQGKKGRHSPKKGVLEPEKGQEIQEMLECAGDTRREEIGAQGAGGSERKSR